MKFRKASDWCFCCVPLYSPSHGLLLLASPLSKNKMHSSAEVCRRRDLHWLLLPPQDDPIPYISSCAAAAIENRIKRQPSPHQSLDFDRTEPPTTERRPSGSRSSGTSPQRKQSAIRAVDLVAARNAIHDLPQSPSTCLCLYFTIVRLFLLVFAGWNSLGGNGGYNGMPNSPRLYSQSLHPANNSLTIRRQAKTVR